MINTRFKKLLRGNHLQQKSAAKRYKHVLLASVLTFSNSFMSSIAHLSF